MRVSRVGDREGERSVSPDDQRQRIQNIIEPDGMTLVEVHDERDISGSPPR